MCMCVCLFSSGKLEDYRELYLSSVWFTALNCKKENAGCYVAMKQEKRK